MLCGNCGRQNSDDAVYCRYCGSKMQAEEADKETVQPPQPAPPPPPQKTKQQSSNLIIACGVIAVVGVVGVSVLAVLAAILFPVFARSKEKAQQTSCMSNLKQISLGMLMYASDYDEHLPMKGNWCDAVYPYVTNRQIFVCPLLPDAECGYAYNSQLSEAYLRRITSPAKAVSLFDARGGSWNLAGGRELVDPRHNGGPNVAFADGHVKWMSESGLEMLEWGTLPGEQPPSSEHEGVFNEEFPFLQED